MLGAYGRLPGFGGRGALEREQQSKICSRRLRRGGRDDRQISEYRNLATAQFLACVKLSTSAPACHGGARPPTTTAPSRNFQPQRHRPRHAPQKGWALDSLGMGVGIGRRGYRGSRRSQRGPARHVVEDSARSGVDHRGLRRRTVAVVGQADRARQSASVVSTCVGIAVGLVRWCRRRGVSGQRPAVDSARPAGAPTTPVGSTAARVSRRAVRRETADALATARRCPRSRYGDSVLPPWSRLARPLAEEPRRLAPLGSGRPSSGGSDRTPARRGRSAGADLDADDVVPAADRHPHRAAGFALSSRPIDAVSPVGPRSREVVGETVRRVIAGGELPSGSAAGRGVGANQKPPDG